MPQVSSQCTPTGDTACSDSGTNPLLGTGQSVALSFSGRRPAGVSGAMAAENALADTLVIGSGTDTLRSSPLGRSC